MSHILNKAFSFLFGRSSVSSIQKKTLIVNFKKAVDNKIRFINLKGFSEVSFGIEKVESAHPQFGNNYNLFMSTKTDLASTALNTSLGHFETKENADKALLDLNNKMYGKSLTITSFLVTLMIVFLVSLMLLDYASVQVSKLFSSSRSSQILGSGSPMPSQAQIQEQMRKYMEAQRAEQGNNPAPQAVKPANQPDVNFATGTEDAKNVLNVLK